MFIKHSTSIMCRHPEYTMTIRDTRLNFTSIMYLYVVCGSEWELMGVSGNEWMQVGASGSKSKR
ncbi:MAG: hypothetical protein LBC49_00750 [Bacteroidales bacterium]|nr:hypothetical protein [Bacteroidales bacterium]